MTSLEAPLFQTQAVVLWMSLELKPVPAHVALNLQDLSSLEEMLLQMQEAEEHSKSLSEDLQKSGFSSVGQRVKTAQNVISIKKY